MLSQKITEIKNSFFNYGDLLEDFSILTADVFYLLGKASSNFPQKIASYAFGYLNYCGLLSIPYSLKALQKKKEDLSFAIRVRNYEVIFLSLGENIQIAGNLFLVISRVFLATIKILGQGELALYGFAFLSPIGTYLLVLTIFIDIAKTFHEISVEKRLKAIDSPQLYQMIKSPLQSIKTESLKSASAIRECFEHHAWRALINADNYFTIKNQCLQYLKIENIWNISQWAIRFSSYIAMYISAKRPDSFIQALTWTVFSCIYTIGHCRKKMAQEIFNKKTGLPDEKEFLCLKNAV